MEQIEERVSDVEKKLQEIMIGFSGISPKDTNSITFKLNAKGQATWEFKLKFQEDISTDQMVSKVKELNDKLHQTFGAI